MRLPLESEGVLWLQFWCFSYQSNVFSFTQRRGLSCFKRRKERFSCFWRILPDAGVNLIFDFFHFPRFRATHRFGKACFPVNVDPGNRSWPISSQKRWLEDHQKCRAKLWNTFKKGHFGTKVKTFKKSCSWVFHPESLQEIGTWLSKGT